MERFPVPRINLREAARFLFATPDTPDYMSEHYSPLVEVQAVPEVKEESQGL